MAKWASNMILDGGGDYLRTASATAGRIKLHLLKSYQAGQTHAAVSVNSLGEISMAPADFPATNYLSGRRTTIRGKTLPLTANSGSNPDLHVALIDSVQNEVLLVTDETSDQIVTAGGTFSIPDWAYTTTQPV